MKLKEAFQAQNKINSLLSTVSLHLEDGRQLKQVTEKHLKGKALSGLADETIDQEADTDRYDVGKMLQVCRDLLAEKAKLGTAIGKAKAGMAFDFDVAIDTNRSRRRLIPILSAMASLKDSHSLRRSAGTGYTFNKDGNQVEYLYDIDYITTIRFDRNKVRALLKTMQEEANELSLQIDKAQLEVEVDYQPSFDVNGDDTIIFDELMARA